MRRAGKYTISVLLLVVSTKVFSHAGGHFHSGDGNVLNTWQLKNGSVVKGNFSYGRNGSIVLEQEDGRMIQVAVADLSLQDQKLANLKINRLKQSNEDLVADKGGYTTNSREDYSRYTDMIVSCGIVLLTLVIIDRGRMVITSIFRQNRKPWMTPVFLLGLIAVMLACKKTVVNTIATISFTKTRTSFIDSAFAPYKPAVTTRWDDNYFYVASSGLPAHNMMEGITNWQQQVPIPQFYTGSNSWSIPLQPVYATTPLSTKSNLMKGAVAIAVNGIPIFNALNNRGEDSYQIGELDNWGGHCGKADDYHYHAAPLHLATSPDKPIAFALDGFPVYGNKEPDGSPLQALDSCHGHMGSDGLYHYYGTTTYPYVIGAMRGKVSLDPSTAAPENQIIPQAFASPLRPATTPLKGAVITAFTSTGTNGYRLTYQVGTKQGYIDYGWNAAGLYTYSFKDTMGLVTSSTYQR